MLKMEKRKISFLGDLLIIIVVFIFVVLFLNQMNLNNVKKIEQINQKHGISKQILVANDISSYIADLSLIEEKEITEPLIEFNKLSLEISEIEKSLYRASVVREECISRDLKIKINSAFLKIETLEKTFKEKDSKKYASLYFEDYSFYLSNLKKIYFKYKVDIENIPVCRLL